MFNDTFKSSSIFLKLSLIPAFLGFVNHLVSFASSNWRVIDTPVPLLKIYPHVDHTYCGLWNCYSCLSNNADCESALFPLEDAIVVTRVFVTIGLFLSCGTLSLTLLCLFISEVASHEYVHIGTILISISTGGCVLIGVVVYGSSTSDHDSSPINEEHSLHWSYYLCAVAFFMYFINGLLLFLNVLRIKTS